MFVRYMMLSFESRESRDERSPGELFLYFTDEMADITWVQAFQLLLQMFREVLSDACGLPEEKITEFVDTFISTLPIVLQMRLKAI